MSVGTNSSAYCEDECSVGHEYRVLQCHAWLVVVLSLAIPILALAVFSFLWRKKSKQRKRDLALTRGLLLHEHSYVDNIYIRGVRACDIYIYHWYQYIGIFKSVSYTYVGVTRGDL